MKCKPVALLALADLYTLAAVGIASTMHSAELPTLSDEGRAAWEASDEAMLLMT
ncbi:MAG: hypothetical protein WCS99_01695 [Limisphaerales bacterium]